MEFPGNIIRHTHDPALQSVHRLPSPGKFSPPQRGSSGSLHPPFHMKPLFTLVDSLVALATLPSAHAASIVGTINFSPGADGGIILQDSGGFSTTNFMAATGVKSWLNSKVNSASGSFATVPSGQSVTFDSAPWNFNMSPSLKPFSSIAGTGNFSFALTSSTLVSHTKSFLFVSGTGILSGDNFSDTPAVWYFSTHVVPINGKFNWSSSITAIPETGTTTILATTAAALCLLRRRKSC